jgi:hypothetical protein
MKETAYIRRLQVDTTPTLGERETGDRPSSWSRCRALAWIGSYAALKSQRREAFWPLLSVLTSATDESPNSERHVAEQRSKGHAPISFAGQIQPAMPTRLKCSLIVDAFARTISAWIAARTNRPAASRAHARFSREARSRCWHTELWAARNKCGSLTRPSVGYAKFFGRIP